MLEIKKRTWMLEHEVLNKSARVVDFTGFFVRIYLRNLVKKYFVMLDATPFQ